MKPRIFVSSVIKGFEEFREAARRGSARAEGEPVLVEDFPSLPKSSRNVCLDGVGSSDILIIVVGARAGSCATSGKLIVEEEYEEAVRLKLPVIVFIQVTEHDELAEGFVKRLSNYVDGVFRQSFKTPAELETAVYKALVPIVTHFGKSKVDTDMINEKLHQLQQITNEAVLRFVIAPERADEFIDPVEIESAEFKNSLFQIGHSCGVKLFSYERSKETQIETNSIVILQSEQSRQEFVDAVRMEMTTEGVIAIDVNISNCVQRDRFRESLCSMAIIESDVMEKLSRAFAFVRDVFANRDPFMRYGRFSYNISLIGIGYRTLMPKPPERGAAYSLGNHSDQPMVIFDKPRIISRDEIAKPEKEIERIMVVLRRRLNNK